MTDLTDRLERLFDDVWNGNDPSAATDLVHPEYVIHDRELADERRGPELYRELATRTRAVFPDAAFTIEGVVAAPPSVALRWTMCGTHDGPLFGVDPTGREVKLTAVEINRFQDGLLRETWTRSDQLGLLQQIGALPTDLPP